MVPIIYLCSNPHSVPGSHNVASMIPGDMVFLYIGTENHSACQDHIVSIHRKIGHQGDVVSDKSGSRC